MGGGNLTGIGAGREADSRWERERRRHLPRGRGRPIGNARRRGDRSCSLPQRLARRLALAVRAAIFLGTFRAAALAAILRCAPFRAARAGLLRRGR